RQADEEAPLVTDQIAKAAEAPIEEELTFAPDAALEEEITAATAKPNAPAEVEDIMATVPSIPELEEPELDEIDFSAGIEELPPEASFELDEAAIEVPPLDLGIETGPAEKVKHPAAPPAPPAPIPLEKVEAKV